LAACDLIGVNRTRRCGGMADATDLKSVERQLSCGFESRHRHQLPEPFFLYWSRFPSDSRAKSSTERRVTPKELRAPLQKIGGAPSKGTIETRIPGGLFRRVRIRKPRINCPSRDSSPVLARFAGTKVPGSIGTSLRDYEDRASRRQSVQRDATNSRPVEISSPGIRVLSRPGKITPPES
jgi:hypothetical protein